LLASDLFGSIFRAETICCVTLMAADGSKLAPVPRELNRIFVWVAGDATRADSGNLLLRVRRLTCNRMKVL
jgi:hypothetical protein